MFEADAALFRRCLGTPGGSCQDASASPLPHSSQQRASRPLAPTSGGTSATLATARRELPAGHPAQTALQVVDHPVVAQATALHEAVFDAHEGLPALAPVGQPLRATGLTLGDYSLPLFTSPTGNVNAADLSRMTNFNDSTAASTRIITGRIISGIGPLSLNNPPLEDLIAEIITTSVGKAAEEASWCWYACDLDVQLKALESETGKTVTDAAHSLSQQLGSEADRVKLRLHLAR